MIPNIDRVPVNVAPNGAIKYGVYDASGNLIRYEYIKREDGATIPGKIINKEALDEFLAASGTTTGTSDALVLAQQGFVLEDGAAIRFKLHADLNKGATINVNATGAKLLVDAKGKPQKAKAGSWCTAVYSSTAGNFILQGSGGDAATFGNEPGQISAYQFIDMRYVMNQGR